MPKAATDSDCVATGEGRDNIPGESSPFAGNVRVSGISGESASSLSEFEMTSRLLTIISPAAMAGFRNPHAATLEFCIKGFLYESLIVRENNQVGTFFHDISQHQ